MALSARQYFDEALHLWGGLVPGIRLEEPTTRGKLLSLASYLQMAVTNAQEPFPEANARLSFVLLLLEENKRAEANAKTAIWSRPYSFWARLTLFWLAVMKLANHNPYSDFSNVAGAAITLGLVAAKSEKAAAVRKSAREVAQAFIETVKSDFLAGNDIDVRSYLEMGEILLGIADRLRQNQMREDLLYRVILQVPWESTNLGTYEREVSDLRIRAEGLLHV